MNWPQDINELERLGWKLEQTRSCKGRDCRQLIAFFRSPQGTLMPLTKVPDGSGRVRPHFVDCKNIEQFKKKRKSKGASACSS